MNQSHVSSHYVKNNYGQSQHQNGNNRSFRLDPNELYNQIRSL
jgi:hypothetical protein